MDATVSKFPQYRYYDAILPLERRFDALLGGRKVGL